MRLKRLHLPRRRLPHLLAGILTSVLLLVMAVPVLLSSSADAALLQLRSVTLSDGTAGETDVTYKFTFSTNTNGPIGSIRFEVCSNYQYDTTDPCTIPDGFDASGAALNTSSGVTDFSLEPPITNELLLTRPTASPVMPQEVSYEFTHITSPSDIGSYYVHISTYASTDGTGPEVDRGDVVFATTLDIQITTEVPPYLLFCTGITIDGYNCGTAEGGLLNFGELSPVVTRAATSQMLASTNAAYGYSITLAGSTMTAGNNVIPAMEVSGPSRPGVSQFGVNARFNTGPGVGLDPLGPGMTTPSIGYDTPNMFRFKSGEVIASSDHTDDYRKLTVSYIVNRSQDQPPGKYVATVSYICLANF